MPSCPVLEKSTTSLSYADCSLVVRNYTKIHNKVYGFFPNRVEISGKTYGASEFLVPQGKDHLVSLYLREDRHVNISQTSQNSLDGQFGPSSSSQVSFVSFLRALTIILSIMANRILFYRFQFSLYFWLLL